MDYGFSLGSIIIRYYSLTLAIAILVCWYLALKFVKKRDLDVRHAENLLFVAVFAGLLGARAFVVIFNWDYFQDHLSEIYQIWRGGLAIYGAVIGALAATFLYAKWKKFAFWHYLDVLAIVTPLGQAIGRWGNFFNQEAFGPPTNLPWKIAIDPENRPLQYLNENYFHPTFLYESLWDLTVFAGLLYLSSRVRRPGVLFSIYLGFYALGRFFIEYLRLDSQYLFIWRLNQIVSVFVFSLAVIIFFRRTGSSAQNT